MTRTRHQGQYRTSQKLTNRHNEYPDSEQKNVFCRNRAYNTRCARQGGRATTYALRTKHYATLAVKLHLNSDQTFCNSWESNPKSLHLISRKTLCCLVAKL